MPVLPSASTMPAGTVIRLEVVAERVAATKPLVKPRVKAVSTWVEPVVGDPRSQV